jgi:CubicO group peptidase (beta-lactamase class C family)
MQKLFTLLLVFLSCASCEAQNFAQRADQYLNKYSREQFMGSVLVARAGKVLFTKSYGFADLENDVLNTPETKFNICSLTKQFTGLAVLQLAERGKLKLEDLVSKYYEEAPPAWEKITIYHLLSHTSGIPNPGSLNDYPKGIAQPYTPKELIAIFRDKPLDFPPGAKRKYSNSGYYLLGLIIEKASGQKYADYIQQNIFGPLGMRDSGYESNTAILKHRASGYALDGKNFQHADYVDWTVPYAAGALYSTVENLLRWDQALYMEKLLNRSSLDHLFTPEKSGYNYGWFIKTENGRQKIYHEGGNPGYAAFIARYPADKTFVIVLSNLETAPVSKIADDLVALSFGESVATPKASRQD